MGDCRLNGMRLCTGVTGHPMTHSPPSRPISVQDAPNPKPHKSCLPARGQDPTIECKPLSLSALLSPKAARPKAGGPCLRGAARGTGTSQAKSSTSPSLSTLNFRAHGQGRRLSEARHAHASQTASQFRSNEINYVIQSSCFSFFCAVTAELKSVNGLVSRRPMLERIKMLGRHGLIHKHSEALCRTGWPARSAGKGYRMAS